MGKNSKHSYIGLMQTKSISQLSYFALSEPVTISFLAVHITNETPVAAVVDDSFVKHFGIREIGFITESPALLYSIDTTELSDYSNEAIKEKSIAYVKASIAGMRSIDIFLWLIKDNSVSCETMLTISTKISTGKVLFNSDYHFKHINTNSKGEAEKIWFSKSELNEAVTIMDSTFKLCPKFKRELHLDTYVYEEDDNRLEKCIKFIIAARGNSFLRAKLAMYMSAFECLFSTEAGELTLKVGTRAAYYIGKDKTQRLDVFDTIKAAYDIRSKYLHGGEPPKNNKSKTYLTELSEKVDSLLREIVLKVIRVDSEIFLFMSAEPTPQNRDAHEKSFARFLKELTL